MSINLKRKQKYTISLINKGRGMSNFEIINKAKKLDLPNFKYYMLDEVPKQHLLEKECGILNLDHKKNRFSDYGGTHHTCWWIDGNKKYYFDSYGVEAPKRMIKYLGKGILSSTHQFQQYNETNCSEYCLYVLNELNKGHDFIDIVLNLIKEDTF